MTTSGLPAAGSVRVSCIVPAYNEGARLGNVLRALIGHPLIDELIVVDDGSADDTTAVALSAGVDRVIRCDENVGKSRALSAGIEAASGDLLLLIDADLSGLTAAHVTDLLEPVLKGRVDVAISLRSNAPAFRHLIGLDYITGERVLPAALLRPRLDEIRALPKFGFEVFLNRICIEHKCRLAVVGWPGVESPQKSRKRGVLAGLLGEALMVADICKTISPVELVTQLVTLVRLRVELHAEPPLHKRLVRAYQRYQGLRHS